MQPTGMTNRIERMTNNNMADPNWYCAMFVCMVKVINIA